MEEFRWVQALGLDCRSTQLTALRAFIAKMQQSPDDPVVVQDALHEALLIWCGSGDRKTHPPKTSLEGLVRGLREHHQISRLGVTRLVENAISKEPKTSSDATKGQSSTLMSADLLTSTPGGCTGGATTAPGSSALTIVVKLKK